VHRFKFVRGVLEERYTVHSAPDSSDATDSPIALEYTSMIQVGDNVWVVDSHWSSEIKHASLLDEIVPPEDPDDCL
jgi:hypothetical protein